MKKKTALSLSKIFSRKLAIVAIGATLGLAACSDEQTELDDLQTNKDSKLVQGRDEAIKALMENGITLDSATKVVNDLELAQSQLQNQQVVHDTTVVYSNGGTTYNSGSNNALLWYMIGRSHSPTVYIGSPSTGLTYARGFRDDYTPTKLTSTQADYLRAPISSRATMESTLRGRTSTYSSTRSSSFRSTSRGGFSHGEGIGHGS